MIRKDVPKLNWKMRRWRESNLCSVFLPGSSVNTAKPSLAKTLSSLVARTEFCETQNVLVKSQGGMQ